MKKAAGRAALTLNPVAPVALHIHRRAHPPSTRLLAETFLRVERKLPLIGVGGVDSAEAAWAKIRAGASLVQLYSALVYKGPGLVGEIKGGLLERLGREKISLDQAIGRDATDLAQGRF